MPEDLGPVEGQGVTSPAKVGVTSRVEDAALSHDDPSGFPTARLTAGNDAAAHHAVEMRMPAADAPPVQKQEQPRDAQGRFTEADLATARQQEKDKLYGKISDMEVTLAEIRQEREARLKSEADEKAAADETEKTRLQEEMSLRDLLATKENEWEQKFNSIQNERETERALRDKERELFDLQNYRTDQISQSQEEIAPQLRDLITGDSPEEIDASVSAMKQKTAEILGEFAQAAQQQVRQRGVTPTSGFSPDMGQGDAQSSPDLSAADIQGMSMSQYAKMRSRLLGQASRAGGGMFA